jgi:hypothetical protein
METVSPGEKDMETDKHGDNEAWRQEDAETVKQHEYNETWRQFV